jgi:AcrR family transcriptional regulator
VSPRKSDSRDRMILSAAALLREYGASATSIDRVLAHSGAPRGSVYHHFPGGRAQLIDEAVELAGDFIAGLIETATEADYPLAAVDAFFALWRGCLVESDFRSGCPIVAVAVETNDDAPQLARSAAAVFARWREALAALFVRHGLPDERGKRLASFIIAAVEGAVIMCRAERSIAPLDATADEVHDVLVHALRDRPGRADGFGAGHGRGSDPGHGRGSGPATGQGLDGGAGHGLDGAADLGPYPEPGPT